MSVLKRIRGLGRNGRQRVWVGFFGKHPAWDDHIVEAPLETEPLVKLRSVMYTKGIAGQIDSGAWERLDESDRLPGFAHTLLWRTPEGVVAARLVDSVDGKGRARYPLVVCAQFSDIPGRWIVDEGTARIVRLAAGCRGARTQEEVRSLVDAACAELREAAPEPDEAPARGNAGERLARDLGRTALERVVYHARANLRAHVRPGVLGERTWSKHVDTGGRRLRVARGELEGAAACEAWIRVMDHLLGDGTPTMAIACDGQDFVDLLVGEPEGDLFYVLRAGARAEAPVTGIPYEIDDPARACVDAILGDGSGDRDIGRGGR